MKSVWGYKFLVYPYFLGYYNLINTISSNPIDNNPNNLIRSFVIVTLLTTLFLIAAFFITKNWHRAALISALSVFVIFSYGGTYRIFENNELLRNNFAKHYVLLPIILLIVGTIAISYFKLSESRAKFFSNLILIILTITILFPTIRASLQFIYIGKSPFKDWEPDNEILYQSDLDKNQNSKTLPDIYYIILDGYGREDVLNEVHGIDNSEFLNYLEDRGFYIADQSHSNYLQTGLSLASSLNFEYLENLNEIGKKTFHREPIVELISNSKVRTYLEDLGYQIVSFDSGFNYSDIKSADTYLSPFISINGFEKLIFTFSIAVMLDNREDNPIPFYTYNSHRTRLLYTLDQLKNVAKIPGPKFVFAHLIIPHPPFVFDDSGNPITPDRAFDIQDGKLAGTRSEYIQGYKYQVKFTNRQIEMVVDAILNSSSSPPIIIIQGDHGPRMLTNWDSIEDSCIRESASILNAYYLPESGRGALYPTISPVNSFRIILNDYFGTKFNLLEDKTYFSNFLQPFNFVDVTERTDEICSLENVN